MSSSFPPRVSEVLGAFTRETGIALRSHVLWRGMVLEVVQLPLTANETIEIVGTRCADPTHNATPIPVPPQFGSHAVTVMVIKRRPRATLAHEPLDGIIPRFCAEFGAEGRVAHGDGSVVQLVSASVREDEDVLRIVVVCTQVPGSSAGLPLAPESFESWPVRVQIGEDVPL